jgi:hypothetical protein
LGSGAGAAIGTDREGRQLSIERAAVTRGTRGFAIGSREMFESMAAVVARIFENRHEVLYAATLVSAHSRVDLPAVRITVWAIAFRLFSACVAFLTNVVFPDYQNQGFTMSGAPNLFWDTFTRYDSGWYFQIAKSGFHYTPNGRDSIAFFPVYPLLMRYVGRAIGRRPADIYLGGIVVSWTAFVIAMVGLYALASLDMPRRRAERAVVFAAIFPFAFFFGVVYTESTFLMFTVWTFYLSRTRRWIAGGICGAFATASRVNGILMLPALAWMAWRAKDEAPRDRWRAAIGLVLVTVGVGTYSWFVYQLTSVPGGSHNPLEWAAAIQRWGYHPGGVPWAAPVHLVQSLLTQPYTYVTVERLAPYDILNGLAGMLFVAAVPFVWSRLGAAYGLFMLANLWLPLSSGVFEGVGRYCAVLFPCFIWLASLRSRAVSMAVGVVFATLYTLCLALFTNVHPLF